MSISELAGEIDRLKKELDVLKREAEVKYGAYEARLRIT
jgi:hypothetical protein